jgi:hypothetical protein
MFLTLLAPAAFAVERFGDITVSPETLISGSETRHGYREFRVELQNHSSRDAHVVTLNYPDQAFPVGNGIRQLSRTITVNPASTAVAQFWQPPLPMPGDGNIRVLIDGSSAGVVPMSQSSQHIGSGRGYGGPAVATLLVGRTLNLDEVEKALVPSANSATRDYSAKMATGSPDAGGFHGSMVPNAWSPATSTYGAHWLELDYASPATASRIRIFSVLPLPPGTELTLKGASGTNIVHITVPHQTRQTFQEIPFPQTAEPVKTVRLDFRSVPGGMISIDAVELLGSSGSQWAADARASSEASSSPYSAGAQKPFELVRSEIPAAEWSEAWISYSPFDGIVLNAREFKSLPPAAATAVWRYTECGGNLVLLGGEIPQSLTSLTHGQSAWPEGIAVGFGRCFIVPAEKLSDVENALTPLQHALTDSANYWQSIPNAAAANTMFPVIANSHIPIQGTVFIMMLFVIVIGPVNIVILSRRNRRVWLLWTIPAISFLTCVAVFAYSLLHEGITPDVRIDGLTILDQANHRATTSGTTAFYCPLTPSQGLFFTSDTEATPMVELTGYRMGGGGSQRDIDWTQGQNLRRAWLTSRVPACFRLRKSETSRQRLDLEINGGKIIALNGLGAAIKTLWLADAQGRIYIEHDIPAGVKAALTVPADNPHVGPQRGPDALLNDSGIAPGEFTASRYQYLQPNTYIAELDAAPFIENGLGPKAKSARTRAKSVVYGILDTPVQP